MGTYVCVILSETFSLSESGVARVETSRTEGGHNLEITISTKRRPCATVMQWTNSTNLLGVICDISCRRVQAYIQGFLFLGPNVPAGAYPVKSVENLTWVARVSSQRNQNAKLQTIPKGIEAPGLQGTFNLVDRSSTIGPSTQTWYVPDVTKIVCSDEHIDELCVVDVLCILRDGSDSIGNSLLHLRRRLGFDSMKPGCQSQQ